MNSSAKFATALAVAALSNAIDFALCEPARPISTTITMLHGVCVDSFNTAYFNFYSGNADVFNNAGFDRSHIAGSEEPFNAHAYSIDLLNPYPKFGFQGPLTGDLDSVVAAIRAQTKGCKTHDDAYVLYADGSEESLSSMHDVLTGIKTPWTIAEAMKSPQRKDWFDALKKEMDMLKTMGTYTVVHKSKIPPGQRIVSSKIAWRLKTDKHGNPTRYKARCTARGFSQTYGVDYKETFQPVTRLESVRIFIASAVAMGLPIRQLDFTGAYLQGTADYPIYMSFPPELEALGLGIGKDNVCLLNKSLYGLKQAGARWYATLSAELRKHGFQPSDAEPCLWIYNHNGVKIWMIYHVDDALFMSNDTAKCDQILASINKRLEHTVNKEPADWYVGMRIEQEIQNGKLISATLSQEPYIKQICKSNGIAIDSKASTHVPATQDKLTKLDCPKFSTEHTKAMQAKFQSNVGALLFLARCTMPQIAYAVGRLGRFASNSGPPHWKEMQHLIKYIKTARNMGITYRRPTVGDPTFVRSQLPVAIVAEWNQKRQHFRCYTDSDFAGCPDTSRSTSGLTVCWMSAAVSWASTLQACVTLSTAEAEMVAMSKAAQEVIWVRRLVGEIMGGTLKVPTPLYCDNVATLQLLSQRVHHLRTKHISLRNNFIKEQRDLGNLEPIYVPTDSNTADVFTKPCNQTVMDRHIKQITGQDPKYC